MSVQRICKDCMTEWASDTPPPVTRVRPAPHPGPRCATHHRARRKSTKASTHEAYVARTYGLRPGEYDAILEWQGGVCALCRRANGKTKKLAVDHDHSCCPETPTCGRCTRGALCGPCNKIIGHFRDDAELFRRAADYIEDPPAHDVIERRDG